MGRKATKSKRINFFIPIRMLEEIKKIAKAKGLTYSELIRRFLDRQLKQEKNK